jgi:hypothetical protein
VAFFRCDVTPPVGHPLCGGWIKPLEAVDDPLLAKESSSAGKNRYVICAVDWCLLQTTACDLFREKLARALGCQFPMWRSRLFISCAPVADITAQRLLDSTSNAPVHLVEIHERSPLAWAQPLLRLRSICSFTHIGYASNRVERFASNRRVRLPDD